ncbi:MAG: DUF1559 domain-containing protein, partial [Planctomycetales bacterium]|nr:DUF1559 domain-containing protein [Planctomycetales bacterium]
MICARESTRRAICSSRLRDLGIAVHSYHDRKLRIPAAWRPLKSEPKFLRGWATELLPDLEQPTAPQWLTTGKNLAKDLTGIDLTVMQCPSDIAERTFALHAEIPDRNETAPQSTARLAQRHDAVLRILPTANFLGVFGTTEADEQGLPTGVAEREASDGPVVHDRRVRWSDLERGASVTLLVGERTMSKAPATWLGVDAEGEDAQCRLVGSAMTHPNCSECDECEFSSRHSGGVNFLWGDGHVALLEDDVDQSIYRQYSQRSVH